MRWAVRSSISAAESSPFSRFRGFAAVVFAARGVAVLPDFGQILGAHKATLHGELARMADADKCTGAGDVLGPPARRTLRQRVNPVGEGLQLSHNRLGRILAVFLGQRVVSGAETVQLGLLFGTEGLHLATHAAKVPQCRVIKLGSDFEPFPAFGTDGLGFPFQPLHGEPVEQGRIGEIAFILLGEQVAQDVSARRRIGFDADETRAPVGGFDMGAGQHPPHGRGVAVPLGLLEPCRFLCRVIVADGEGHQLVEVHVPGAVDLDQARADARELEPLPDGRGAAPEAGGDFLRAFAALGERVECLELVGGMHR